MEGRSDRRHALPATGLRDFKRSGGVSEDSGLRGQSSEDSDWRGQKTDEFAALRAG
ncbi:MAG: hypothetical protein LBD06_04360 [Candidatus Accumulibacter sp.]|nr:hypothetical protein [Accumulibacter sp.]